MKYFAEGLKLDAVWSVRLVHDAKGAGECGVSSNTATMSCISHGPLQDGDQVLQAPMWAEVLRSGA